MIHLYSEYSTLFKIRKLVKNVIRNNTFPVSVPYLVYKKQTLTEKLLTNVYKLKKIMIQCTSISFTILILSFLSNVCYLRLFK